MWLWFSSDTTSHKFTDYICSISWVSLFLKEDFFYFLHDLSLKTKKHFFFIFLTISLFISFMLLVFFICIVILNCSYFKVKARSICPGSRCELTLLLLHTDIFAYWVSPVKKKLSWVCCRDEQEEGQPLGQQPLNPRTKRALFWDASSHLSSLKSSRGITEFLFLFLFFLSQVGKKNPLYLVRKTDTWMSLHCVCGKGWRTGLTPQLSPLPMYLLWSAASWLHVLHQRASICI